MTASNHDMDVDLVAPNTDAEASSERDHEGLDLAAFDEEPWSDLDPEAFEDPEDAEEPPVSFGGPVPLRDTSTRERWLQSALRALVAPTLGVDGVLGPRTTAAVAKFQRRAKALVGKALLVDGIAGRDTTAALEAATSSTAPALTQPAKVAAPSPAPSTRAGGLALREVVDGKGVISHHIGAGDQEVSFSYWTPAHRKYQPYCVSRYRGARKGLLIDEDFASVGYSKSELGILRANALEESGGAFGAINTWDDQLVSWGMAQFAGLAGTLAVLLAGLREDERTRGSFERWFLHQGIDVDRGPYPWKPGQTKSGWHVVVTADDGRVHRGSEGWQHVRTQPRLIGAFLLAGNDPAIQLGQVAFWRRSFLRRALDKQVSFATGPGGPIRRYVTSERGLAVIVRLHNWMPAHVVRWSNRFIAELEAASPGLDLSDPFEWDQALEDAFVQKICDERKRVKSGSYDGYARGLSTTRGSFVGGTEPT